MDKNQKEKTMLFEFAVENSGRYHFQEMDRTKESYFIQRPESSYIREYGFETLPELMKELTALWDGDEMMGPVKKVIGVAAMKNKPMKAAKEKAEGSRQEEKEETLPAFIYNF